MSSGWKSIVRARLEDGADITPAEEVALLRRITLGLLIDLDDDNMNLAPQLIGRFAEYNLSNKGTTVGWEHLKKEMWDFEQKKSANGGGKWEEWEPAADDVDYERFKGPPTSQSR